MNRSIIAGLLDSYLLRREVTSSSDSDNGDDKQTLHTSRETEADCRAGYGSVTDQLICVTDVYTRTYHKNSVSKYLQTVHCSFKFIEFDWTLRLDINSLHFKKHSSRSLSEN